jgi:GAF domain-containing protein
MRTTIAANEPVRTAWFDDATAPARPGVYERREPAGPYACWDGRGRRDDAGSTVAQVIRTGHPILRSDIPAESLRLSTGVKADPVADLHRRLATRSVLAVPIRLGERVLGAVSLCYSDSGRSYVARDVPAATRLAMRIARVLTSVRVPDATVGLRPAARHPRQGTTIRRRVAARN